MSRFSRNEGLLGAEGQDKIANTRVAICGLGGLGSHIGQQLALLGVRSFTLVDFDVATESSLNRLVGAGDEDPRNGVKKTEISRRLIKSIDPKVSVTTLEMALAQAEAAQAIGQCDLTFGCLDKDIHRLELLTMVAGEKKPLIDSATDVVTSGNSLVYGGRVVVCDGHGCLACLPGILDQSAIARESLDPESAEAHGRIYGVNESLLEGTGPSVVSINGVVSSLAVTEFMAFVTGLRPAKRQLTYRGESGVVTSSLDEGDSACYFCSKLAELAPVSGK